MTPPPSAFLALWNNVSAEIDDEYNRWHTREHVPERVGVAGFYAGRRYVSDAPGQHRYLTLYETASAAVFTSPGYLDVIDQPTPWSTAMRGTLTDVVRAPCGMLGMAGGNEAPPAPAVCCLRIFMAAEHAVLDARDIALFLQRCVGLAGVTRSYIGSTRISGAALPGAFKNWADQSLPTYVLIVEGESEALLRGHCDALIKLSDTTFKPTAPSLFDSYYLRFSIRHNEVDASLRRSGAAPGCISP